MLWRSSASGQPHQVVSFFCFQSWLTVTDQLRCRVAKAKSSRVGRTNTRSRRNRTHSVGSDVPKSAADAVWNWRMLYWPCRAALENHPSLVRELQEGYEGFDRGAVFEPLFAALHSPQLSMQERPYLRSVLESGQWIQLRKYRALRTLSPLCAEDSLLLNVCAVVRTSNPLAVRRAALVALAWSHRGSGLVSPCLFCHSRD